MTKAKAKKKQLEIPGAERQTDDELDALVSDYTAALYERMELQKSEAERKEGLLEAMRKKRVKKYTYVDGETKYHVTLTDKAALACKREKPRDTNVELLEQVA